MAEDQDGKLLTLGKWDKRKFIMCKKELDAVFTRNPTVSNSKVVIVSVHGEYNNGKALLLNILFKYLENHQNEDWLNEIPNKFPWALRSSESPVESHLRIWDKPFMLNLPDVGQFAVFLMDVPEDTGTSLEYDLSMFVLSSSLSSIHIVTSHGDVFKKTKDLWQLVDLSQKIEGFCLPSSLKFLTYHEKRDSNSFLENLWSRWPLQGWTNKTNDGFIEGDKVLNEKIKVRDSDLGFIKSAYDDVSCFMASHPGDAVNRQNFNGALHDLQEAFRDDVKDFIKGIFHPNVMFKKINGNVVTGTQLATHVKKVYGALNLKRLERMFKKSSETERVKTAELSVKAVDSFLLAFEKIQLKGDTRYNEALQDVVKLKTDVIQQYEKEAVYGSLGFEEGKQNLVEHIDDVTNEIIAQAGAEIHRSGVPELASYSFLVTFCLSMAFFGLYCCFECFNFSSDKFCDFCWGSGVFFGCFAVLTFLIMSILFLYIKKWMCISSGGKLFMVLEGLVRFWTSPSDFFLRLLPKPVQTGISFGSKLRSFFKRSNEPQATLPT